MSFNSLTDSCNALLSVALQCGALDRQRSLVKVAAGGDGDGDSNAARHDGVAPTHREGTLANTLMWLDYEQWLKDQCVEARVLAKHAAKASASKRARLDDDERQRALSDVEARRRMDKLADEITEAQRLLREASAERLRQETVVRRLLSVPPLQNVLYRRREVADADDHFERHEGAFIRTQLEARDERTQRLVALSRRHESLRAAVRDAEGERRELMAANRELFAESQAAKARRSRDVDDELEARYNETKTAVSQLAQNNLILRQVSQRLVLGCGENWADDADLLEFFVDDDDLFS